MSLTKYNNHFGSTWNSFVDHVLNDFSSMENSSGALIPAANIKDEKEAFIISLAVPGIKKEEFNIELKHGQLIISGENRKSSEDQEDNYTRKEYNYSSFKRSFNLPKNVKEEDIEAKYEDGELKIRIPKSQLKDNGNKQIKVA